MRRTKLSISRYLIVIWTVVFIGYVKIAQTETVQNIELFKEYEKKAKEKINYGKAIDYISEKLGKREMLIDACVASFTKAGVFEYAIGSIDFIKGEINYNVLVDKNSEKGMFELFHLATYQADMSQMKRKIDIGVTIGVNCQSYTEAKRLNKIIEGAANAGAHGEIKPISDLDIICVTPAPAESLCFGWNTKLRKFEEIGGWIT